MKKKQPTSKTKKKKKPLTPQEKLKYEIAEELGLMEKVQQLGWAGLTAAESGKIGGHMTRIMMKKKDKGPSR